MPPHFLARLTLRVREGFKLVTARIERNQTVALTRDGQLLDPFALSADSLVTYDLEAPLGMAARFRGKTIGAARIVR